MKDQDTIAAISTPVGTGAIAMVRISGPKTYEFLEQIFSSSSKELKRMDFRTTRRHKVIHGYIHSHTNQQLIDEVVCVNYFAPNSYTAEDLVEVNCHGNPLISNEILSTFLELGARLAHPGEFTQRAFLAGKMDLTQAESVLDLIQAKTGRQSRLALSALEGHIGKKIFEVRKDLMSLLTKLIAGIDFPEEVGELPKDNIEEACKKARDSLAELSKTTRTGRFLRDGLKLSLIGRPNAGKSSLLNQLLKFDRAIVSDTPGTTRDSIEEQLDINGIPVTLIDTAGVRVTDDSIELAGISRTTRAIQESDLNLFIVDSTKKWDESEDKVLQLLNGNPFFLVVNKIDLEQSKQALNDNLNTFIEKIEVSAFTKEGIEDLSKAIEDWALKDSQLVESGGSLNQRQGELCLKAISLLEEVLVALESGMLEDCIATDLKSAILCLSHACGDEVTEEVITEVFSRFCIGK